MIKNSLFSLSRYSFQFLKGEYCYNINYISKISKENYFTNIPIQKEQQIHTLQYRSSSAFSSMDKKKQTKKGNTDHSKEDKAPKATSSVPASIYEKGGKFFISIHAKPNSKVSQLTCKYTHILKIEFKYNFDSQYIKFYMLNQLAITDEGIDINIAAPPKDGEANAELIDFISQALGIKKSSLSLDKGGKSRNKLMEITDSGYSDVEELYQALKDSIS